MFIAPQGDHYITRLTHTLQVSQIARTISQALKLNQDLAEAIALGHDLGHTPFGHTGEEVLNKLFPEGFAHNEQSLRVVDKLENKGKGLNLTWEVREGILKHSKTRKRILGEDWDYPSTLEGQVCKLADFIAYINHDVEDAIRAGLLREEDLPSKVRRILGKSPSERLKTLILDVIESSWGVREGTLNVITMSSSVREAAEELREFLFEKVYNVLSESREAKRSEEVLRLLYNWFLKHPEKLPPEFLSWAESTERAIVDYIAGMTDQFALNLAREIEGA